MIRRCWVLLSSLSESHMQQWGWDSHPWDHRPPPQHINTGIHIPDLRAQWDLPAFVTVFIRGWLSRIRATLPAPKHSRFYPTAH